MNKQDLKLLEARGWVVECESPFEIRHEDGSFATGQAAHMVLEGLREFETGETEDVGRDVSKDVTLTVGGQSFRCGCGCNVFHHPVEWSEVFECNACGNKYRGEK